MKPDIRSARYWECWVSPLSHTPYSYRRHSHPLLPHLDEDTSVHIQHSLSLFGLGHVRYCFGSVFQHAGFQMKRWHGSKCRLSAFRVCEDVHMLHVGWALLSPSAVQEDNVRVPTVFTQCVREQPQITVKLKVSTLLSYELFYFKSNVLVHKAKI